MVKFLIHRPIAVTMTFIAILVLGVVATRWLPVSLMPEVDIPKVTVQVGAANMSAREVENTITGPLRLQLMQLSHLSDMRSESRDGSATIRLDFEHGSNLDLAFIEVNEKIDRAMSNLPRDIERPRVVKASATDIPVFYLNLTLKQPPGNNQQSAKNPGKREDNTESHDAYNPSGSFIELSNFAGHVIRKRIEQLPQVAMADISGQVFTRLLILPDEQKIEFLNIPMSAIEQSLHQHNINLGNLLIRDGQYQYNVRVGNELLNKQDIESVYINHQGRLFKLNEIADVIEEPRQRKGMVVSDGKDAITLAVIKQSDARMNTLKSELNYLMEHLRSDYPHIEFTITRDQTKLLDYSMDNLKQNLLYGAILAFMVMFLFLKDFRSPVLIGITIPSSLLVTLLFFHVAGISLNIISLSGLVLGLGMMIDNSIIVIDNITQHRERGSLLARACITGTNEVSAPMLSAVLTTCAVFIPLIFLGGITGALFYDQAAAVTIALFVSLGVAVMVLPVYYRIIYQRHSISRKNGILEKINKVDYAKLYKKGFLFTLKNQWLSWIIVAVILAGTVLLFGSLPRTKLPAIASSDTMLRIDWNERVNINTNNARVQQLVSYLDDHLEQNTSIIGEQQFLLDHESTGSFQEALVYLKAHSPGHLNNIHTKANRWLRTNYPQAIHHFGDAGNIFDLVFGEDEPPLTARLWTIHGRGQDYNHNLQHINTMLRKELPGYYIPPAPWEEQMELRFDPELIALYEIDFGEAYNALRRAFSENELMVITGSQEFVPVVLGDKPRLVNDIIAETTVRNRNGESIRLSNLFRQRTDVDLKTIVAGSEGEYFPVPIEVSANEIHELMKNIRHVVAEQGDFEVSFSGSYFSNLEMLSDLMVILIISLLLLYFIMAAQFESLTMPLIVLCEVPISLFGALLLLKLAGQSINLMSMIGIVVMCGIIINDSIIKIDTINKLRKQGFSLKRALMTGGERRLKPIIMTSLTTILAITPLLFTHGMGSDLQRPLSLAIIGGMIVGTMVSLYFIPLAYYYLFKNSK